MAETVGQVFDRRGQCALMAAVVKLAEARGRIPVGHWIVNLYDGYELEVNGTPQPIAGIPPWEAVILYRELPVATFNAVEGVVLGDEHAEDRLIALVTRAVNDR